MNLLDQIAAHSWLMGISALVLGLLIGSFLNVVIYRLPRKLMAEWRQECAAILAESDASAPATESNASDTEKLGLVLPASHCPHCKAAIKPWHNIPLLSYAFLRGKCHACGADISPRYPVIELITGLLTLFVVYQLGLTWHTLLIAVFTWALIALTVIDIDHQLLPDDITLPLLWLGLLANSFGLFTSLENALYGAVAGYLSLWSVYWLFKFATGKEGMGYGDFKLLAALGAWMGWQALPLIILLSSLVGAVVGIAGIVILGRNRNLPIPFGPYLAAAGWLAMFWGDTITQAYFRFIGL